MDRGANGMGTEQYADRQVTQTARDAQPLKRRHDPQGHCEEQHDLLKMFHGIPGIER